MPIPLIVVRSIYLIPYLTKTTCRGLTLTGLVTELYILVYQPSKIMIPNAETLCSCPMYQYKGIAVINITPVVILMLMLMLMLIQYNLQSSTHLATHILLC